VLEIGAGPLAQRLYIPLEQVIRDIAKNYHLHTPGGNMSFSMSSFDSRHGTTVVPVAKSTDGASEDVTIANAPTVFKLNVNDLAHDPVPVVKLQIGMVELDAEVPLCGSDSLDWRDIVLEFQVEEYVADAEGRSVEAIRAWMDKKGTLNACFMGSHIVSVEQDKEEYVQGSRMASITQDDVLEAGSRKVDIAGNDELTVAGTAVRRFLGGIELDLQGGIKMFGTAGPLELDLSGFRAKLTGTYKVDTTGDIVLKATRGIVMTSMNDFAESVAGVKKIKVMKKTNLAATRSFEVQSLGGLVMLDSKPLSLTGLVPYMSGITFRTAASRMIMDDLGNVYIRGASPSGGGPYMEINATGIAITNGTGQGVFVDRKGQVALGVPLGIGHGNVVTTLTHPVCYVTGAPILGSTMVTAMSAPPAPLVSIPNAMVTGVVPAESAFATEEVANILNNTVV
jgi:hypothetical protein